MRRKVFTSPPTLLTWPVLLLSPPALLPSPASHLCPPTFPCHVQEFPWRLLSLSCSSLFPPAFLPSTVSHLCPHAFPFHLQYLFWRFPYLFLHPLSPPAFTYHTSIPELVFPATTPYLGLFHTRLLPSYHFSVLSLFRSTHTSFPSLFYTRLLTSYPNLSRLYPKTLAFPLQLFPCPLHYPVPPPTLLAYPFTLLRLTRLTISSSISANFLYDVVRFPAQLLTLFPLPIVLRQHVPYPHPLLSS